MAPCASSDSRRPRNPYERLRPEFLEAHDDFAGFRVEAYPLQETCKRRPPDFGLCEFPGVERLPSATYGLYAASSADDALVGDEFAKALERFRSLAKRAGDLLPMSIRDVLPYCGSGTVGLWIRFLWYFGLPGRSDRAKLEWHFQQVGSGILSTCDGWLSPFRTSSVAIERCRLDTDSPVFFRLDEIPGLAQKGVPAAEGASTPEAERPQGEKPADDERPSALAEDAGKLMEQVTIAVGDENALKILGITKDARLTADDRMRRIYDLDPRCMMWTSPKWSTLLGVTDAAVRQTPWWKEDRRRLLERIREEERRRAE